MGGDLPEDPESICLIAPLAALAGEHQGLPSKGERVLKAVGEHVGLAQMGEGMRVKGPGRHKFGGSHSLFQQREAVRNTPQNRVYVT